MKDSELITAFDEAYRKARDSKQSYNQLYKDGYDYFMNRPHDDVNPYLQDATKNQIRLPAIKRSIKAIADRYINYDISKHLQLSGSNFESEKSKRDLATLIVLFLLRQAGFSMKFQRFLLVRGIFGMCYMSIPFRDDLLPVTAMDAPTDPETGTPLIDQHGEIQAEAISTEELTHICCDINVVYPWDMFVPPDDETDLQEKEWVIHRKVVRVEDIQENDSFKNVKKIGDVSYRDYDDIKLYADTIIGKTYGENMDGFAIIYEWYNKEKNTLTVIANEKVVLFHGPNPYATNDNHRRYPFVVSRDDIDPLQYEGMPMWRGIEEFSYQKEKLISQIMDQADLKVNSMWATTATSGLGSNDQMTAEAGKVLKLTGVDDVRKAIQRIDYGSIDPTYMNIISLMEQYEEDYGIPKNLQGLLTNADTATDIMESSEGRNTMARAIDEAIKRDVLTPLVYFLLDRWTQNGDLETTQYLAAENDIEYTEDLQTVTAIDWDVAFDVEEEQDGQQKKLMTMELVNSMIQWSQAVPTIDMNKVIEFAIKEGFQKNPDDFMKDPKQMMEEADMLQQQDEQAAMEAQLGTQNATGSGSEPPQ